MTGGRVIVLGKTGRNFAAGMSGGIAYVLDLENIKVNLEMVHIQELGEADLEFIKTQLKRFQEETNSKVASDLIALSDDEIKSRISKVMPKDYQRVLNAQKAAEISGEDPIKAIMEASRG
jgi:glutamate synthase (NADPH/NADH) large chain